MANVVTSAPAGTTYRAAPRSRRPGGIGRWVVLAVLILALIATLFPFVVAVLNAVKTPADYAANGPVALPHSFDLSALVNFWNEVDYTRKLANSILVSGMV